MVGTEEVRWERRRLWRAGPSGQIKEFNGRDLEQGMIVMH